MGNELDEKLEGLLEKYTELLLGESTDALKQEVKQWIIYSHIAKSMPPLAKHFNETYPEAKDEIKEIIQRIKLMNEAHRSNQDR
ncbi:MULTISPECIES: YusU family protein [Bacillus]|uniref:YusU family protein n=1 Tax=Bacillus TaxID=1386 RepID=UPI00119F9640|nr:MULTISPECIES: YusU family protein [Bacillus]MBU8726487.1 YusU family protein [Bacillus pumilus]MCP1150028.1 YusU family protein [Bacillus sp. 1735sda2]